MAEEALLLIPTLETYWESYLSSWHAVAENAFGVVLTDPFEHENSYYGLDAYLQLAGIRHFTAREAVKADYPWPPQYTWPGLAVLNLVGEGMRKACGRPIKQRHWYRDEAFNAARKGAPCSDHLWACAVDFDFPGTWLLAVRARRAAQKWLTTRGLVLPLKILSLGVGWKTLHVGLLAPRTLELGHRRWTYGKLPTTEKFY